MSQLVNSAGDTLKPNLTTLIPALLEAAGELESVGLSYLSAQFGAQSQTQEMIDTVMDRVRRVVGERTRVFFASRDGLASETVSNVLA